MEKSIFNFDDYKPFLLSIEQSRAHFSRGFRSKLAKEAGCGNGFISQVLNTGAHFSLEQALAIAQYLNLSESETRYFLLLIDYQRAGTQSLKTHFRNLIQEMRDKFLNIKDRVGAHAVTGPEVQATYYSQWYFAAIHMAVTIPSLRTIPKIAEALQLPKNTVENVVNFLMGSNLLSEKNGMLLPGSSYLHLDRKSPNISKHHTNWRMAAIQSLTREEIHDLHYSTVSTFSRADVDVLKAKLVAVVEEYVKTVSSSKKEETMYGFNLDFFKIYSE